MAKQTLPVNFIDDIFAPSANGKRKFTITSNGDGTYEIEDVTDYTQTGSDFGAGQINATNQAVNESCDKSDVIDDPNDLLANQADGKIAGAKAVVGVFSKLIFLDHFTISQSPYVFECFVFRVNGIRTAVVFGSWSGTTSSTSTIGDIPMWRVTNLKLTPDDERVNAKRNIALRFYPITGGSGTLFIGNYEGLRLQVTANKHFFTVSNLYSLATNVPNTVKFGWTTIMECYE